VRQLAFIKPAHLEWHDVPNPTIETADDALVRPIAVTACDGDLAMLRGETPITGPFAFGHEFVAEVIEVGEAVTGFHTGQEVILPVQISCGACALCHKGMTAFCTGVRQPAAWGLGAFGGNWPGAFADALRVPFARHMMVPVPHGLAPNVVASAGDNLADAWRTIAPHLTESPGADVLVVGYGSIGLYAVQIAHALGASRIDYLDIDVDRLVLAESFGANAIKGPPPERVGQYAITVDASPIDMSPNPAGLACALRSVAPGGVCTSIGLYFSEPPFPLLHMWSRGVRFHTGPSNARAHMPQVLALVQTGRIHPELVTSEVVPWDDAAEALAHPSLKPLMVRAPLGKAH
jgi:threonine dehydrogenase-like Zn-dependent dehydrogenase